MADRYFLPDFSPDGSYELSGDELHHLVHVMRVKPGERIQVFDGCGAEATAEVIAIAKRKATLQIRDRRQDHVDGTAQVVLATAVPKADRFRWLVEKATELGVARLIPLQTANSVVDPHPAKLDKMRLAVIAACKQSGRNRLMSIEPTMSFEQFASTVIPTGETYIAVPGGEPLSQMGPFRNHQRPLILAVGPEGGWTAAEVQRAIDAGAHSVSLGPLVLRIETAAIALAAIFGLRSSDSRPAK